MRAVCSYKEQGFPKKQKNTFYYIERLKRPICIIVIIFCSHILSQLTCSNFFVKKMSIPDLKLSFEIGDDFFHYLNFELNMEERKRNHLTLEIKNNIVLEKIRKPRRTVRDLIFHVNLK